MKLLKKIFGSQVTEKQNWEASNMVSCKGNCGTIGMSPKYLKQEQTSSIHMINILSMSDYFYVSWLVKENQVVIANYSHLPLGEQRLFIKKLAVDLMRQGTHFDHISNHVLICGGRGTVSNEMESSAPAKVYDLTKFYANSK